MERRRLKNRTARVFETRAAPNPNRSRRTIMAESQNTTSPAEGAITLTTIAALQAAYERSEAAQLRIDRENCCKNVPHDKLLGDLACSELCAQSEVLEQAILREAPVHLVDVRSAARRVGQKGVRTCSFRWSP